MIDSAPAFIDLVPTIDARKLKLPTAVVSGDGSPGSKFSVPITVTNAGNTPTDKAAVIEVSIYARPSGAADNTTDILVDTLTNQKIGNLKKGRSKTINARFTLPAAFATGNYNLVAVIDTANNVVETNETNNDVATVASVNVAVVVAAAKLPPATFTNQTRRVTITNGTGVFADQGAFRLVLRGNRYSVNIIRGNIMPDAGTFTYSTRGAFGILKLTSDINPKQTVKLSFSTTTTGSYRATVSGGSFQVGDFV